MASFGGKVAFITGAARGQGRSHALRLARDGADIIAVDICAQIESVNYPLATADDLAETVAGVEALDRRIVAVEADVRDPAGLAKALDAGLVEFGRVDFALANAGVIALGQDHGEPAQAFADVLAVNLTGVWNTIRTVVPTMIEQGSGGSIVITSSTAGLKGIGGSTAGGEAYTASKHAVVGLMRNFATNLAKHNIRVNTVHPTGVATPMIMNDTMQAVLADTPWMLDASENLLPVTLVDPADISNAIAWLCSDEARYVTGVALPVDAGFSIK
ncbi:MAG TPA: mycofactocin-coupled SDR family oxidoreductase [Pseudonocardia sp.]|jgi:SDR family mycofactocin-dependent oxidoreductase